MLSRVYSCAVIGLDGVVVEVEVDTCPGLPGMDIVGLPDKAVQESRNRVQAAIKNAGLTIPRKRLVVNLAPASIRKEGPAYDLPIALGVMLLTGDLEPEQVTSTLVVGELSLDGAVRHTRRRPAYGSPGATGRLQMPDRARNRRARGCPGARTGGHTSRQPG